MASLLPLEEVRVCILTAYDVLRDGRVRKQARSLAAAGALVTVVGYGTQADVRALHSEPYSISILPRQDRIAPAVRRADAPGPLNRTLTTAKALVGRGLSVLAPQVLLHRFFYNPAMVAAAVESNPDVVHAHNDLVVPMALAAVEQTGARLVYDSREMFDGYYRKQRNAVMMQRLSDRCERRALAQADAVFTVSPLIAKHLTDRYERPDIHVLYNSLPAAPIEPQPVHHPVRLLAQAGFRDTTYDHLMVEAMVHLRGRAVLTMQGRFPSDEYQRFVEGIITEHGLEDVVTLSGEFEPFDSVALAAAHDIGVATYRADTPSKNLTLSNRLFTYLNAGLAVAMPDVEAHRALTDYGEFGILLDTSSPEAIAMGLGELIQDPERITQMKRAALEAAPLYSWEQQERALVEVYQGLVGR